MQVDTSFSAMPNLVLGICPSDLLKCEACKTVSACERHYAWRVAGAAGAAILPLGPTGIYRPCLHTKHAPVQVTHLSRLLSLMLLYVRFFAPF